MVLGQKNQLLNGRIRSNLAIQQTLMSRPKNTSVDFLLHSCRHHIEVIHRTAAVDGRLCSKSLKDSEDIVGNCWHTRLLFLHYCIFQQWGLVLWHA